MRNFESTKITIAIEITSVLQVLFVISLIRKLFSCSENLNIDIFYLNAHVNNETKETTSNLIKKFFKNIEFFDFTQSRLTENRIREYRYDYLIVRSRMKITSQNRFIFSRKFFSTTGNCPKTKEFIKFAKFDQLISVDDGLSNWEEYKVSYIRQIYFYWKSAIPMLFDPICRKNFGVRHYSLFATNKKYNLRTIFLKTIQDLADEFTHDDEVEHLFIGIWPDFVGDRNRPTDTGKQLELLTYFKNSQMPNFDSLIFIKSHPKFELDLDRKESPSFRRLKTEITNLPTELLIQCLPNLKSIYGFPSTSFFLFESILEKNVEVTVFKKADDATLYPDRADFIVEKNPRVRLYDFGNQRCP